ncbi:putative methyltransferase BLi02856/BL02021, partial [Dissostichus eleginoides]
ETQESLFATQHFVYRKEREREREPEDCFQDLATLILGKDSPTKSTLTGEGNKGEVKDQLDPEKALLMLKNGDVGGTPQTPLCPDKLGKAYSFHPNYLHNSMEKIGP